MKDAKFSSQKNIIEILNIINGNLYKTILDTNGIEVSSQKVLDKVVDPIYNKTVFYLSGILYFGSIDNMNAILAYIKLNGDTVWRKNVFAPPLEGIIFSIDSGSVLTTSSDYFKSTLLKYDSSGQVVWNRKIDHGISSNLIRTLDGGLALTCTTSYEDNDKGIWKWLIKYSAHDVITAIEDIDDQQNVSIVWDASHHELHITFSKNFDLDTDLNIKLYDLSGHIVLDQFVDNRNSSINTQRLSGLYFYELSKGRKVWKGKLSL